MRAPGPCRVPPGALCCGCWELGDATTPPTTANRAPGCPGCQHNGNRDAPARPGIAGPVTGHRSAGCHIAPPMPPALSKTEGVSVTRREERARWHPATGLSGVFRRHQKRLDLPHSAMFRTSHMPCTKRRQLHLIPRKGPLPISTTVIADVHALVAAPAAGQQQPTLLHQYMPTWLRSALEATTHPAFWVGHWQQATMEQLAHGILLALFKALPKLVCSPCIPGAYVVHV